MAAANVKKRKNSIILAVLLCALVCYFVATLISIQSKVKAQAAVNQQLRETYSQQVEDNAELADIIENGNEADNMERIAREQYGYAKPGERVYYDSSAE